MKSTYQIFIILCLLSPLSISNNNESQQRYQRWLNAGDSWYTRWMNLADQSPQMSPDERIPLLSTVLGMANDQKRKLTPQEIEVYERIQSILLETPGHAEYFGKKITDTHREYKKTPYGGITEYRRALHAGWATLKHLPSPETVKVAGEMLSDEWINELDKDHYRPPSLAIAAASILSGLPLKDKPYPFRGEPTTDQVAESLPHWQKWYQEVKEGHRTFSFEGDPNEYDLNGPIREAKNPDIPAATQRPGPSPQEQASDKPPTTPPSRAPWIAAVLAAIITLAGWLFLKKRKAI